MVSLKNNNKTSTFASFAHTIVNMTYYYAVKVSFVAPRIITQTENRMTLTDDKSDNIHMKVRLTIIKLTLTVFITRESKFIN